MRSTSRKILESFLSKQLSSFTYLNSTQFLGAMNDNIYKMLIIFFLIQVFGNENSAIITASVGAVFVLPFILFSSNSGMLADRFSKRNIIVFTKIIELIVMAIGLLAFAFESVVTSYVTLFLMATQSAIFGPSKYGIIPEIVEEERISGANGLLTSFTFLAITIGTFLASLITQLTENNFVHAALICTLIALAGVITSFGIEYTEPAGSSKRLNPRIVRETWSTLKLAIGIPSLVPAIFGSAFFFFLGSFVQMIIIPFATDSLGLTAVQGGYLFILTTIGIGLGSVLTVRLSQGKTELGVVPLAGIVNATALILMYFFAESFSAIVILLTLIGVFGGMYQIPLDSYVQVASPNATRGQMVAATNSISFIGVLFSAGLIYLITLLGFTPAQGFIVMGSIAALVAIVYFYLFFSHIRRFITRK